MTHPYCFKADDATSRQSAYLTFAQTHAVIATEFGDADITAPIEDMDCTNGLNFINKVVPEFETNGISWTAWAWNVDAVAGCGFPVLLTSYRPTTNVLGDAIKGFLQQYGG